MKQHCSSYVQNALLASLPPDEWERLVPDLKPVDMAAQATLHGAREPIEFAYFPLSGFVSLLVEFSDGFSAEVSQVGREGMIGIPLVLGHARSAAKARVWIAGTALRIGANALTERLGELSTLRRNLLRHAAAQMAQSMQLAACNAHHSLNNRLARCLLGLHDRLPGQPIGLTHEGFATLLCAHRPSVSIALKHLQQRGLVRQQMGSLVVCDRAGLEQASCECYVALHGLGDAGRRSEQRALVNNGIASSQ